MAVFGNPTGPIYCFGLIAVAAAGTPSPLSANVADTTGFGTPSGGVSGYTTAGVPALMKINRFIITPATTNTGNVYVCYKGGNKTITNSIIAVLAKGTGPWDGLRCPDASAPFQADQIVIDVDTNGEGAYVTAVIL